MNILTVSANTNNALEEKIDQVIANLKSGNKQKQRQFIELLKKESKGPFRLFLIYSNEDDALSQLTSSESTNVYRSANPVAVKRMVFMFPGQGLHYENIGRDLYLNESIFRKNMELCSRITHKLTGVSIVPDLLYGRTKPAYPIQAIDISSILVFSIEYSLARLLMECYGIHPDGMIGHSLGEYVAACLSGVFSLESALALVIARGNLMKKLPPGKMVGVPMAAKDLLPILPEDVSLAADQGPSCIVSGEISAIDEFAKQLRARRVIIQPLKIERAGHSGMLDPILDQFHQFVLREVRYSPQIPFVSNITGKWITPTQAKSSKYWMRQLRETVQFEKGLDTLLKGERAILLEVGPGNVLIGLASQKTNQSEKTLVFNLLRHPGQKVADHTYLWTQLGRIWLTGTQVTWSQTTQNDLLTWQDTDFQKPDSRPWIFLPDWEPEKRESDFLNSVVGKISNSPLLIFQDTLGISEKLVGQLRHHANKRVCIVQKGTEFSRRGSQRYIIDSGKATDYEKLFQSVEAEGIFPEIICFFWSVTVNKALTRREKDKLVTGCRNLINSLQTFRKHTGSRMVKQLLVSTNHALHIRPGLWTDPLKLQFIKEILDLKNTSQRSSLLNCMRVVDFSEFAKTSFHGKRVVRYLLEEMMKQNMESRNQVIGYYQDVRYMAKQNLFLPVC